MTALVTGATGFVGRNLVASLAKRNEKVRALYRDPVKAQLYLSNNVEAFHGDACDAALLRLAVDGADTIYHCAAAHSSSRADEIRHTNLRSVEVLLDAVRNSDSKARVVLMSSINVLGDRSFSQCTEDMHRRQTGELHVNLKIAAEELAERSMRDGLDIVILRPGLIYGAGDPHLTKMAHAIYHGKFMYLGSRHNIVPLVHISDMVEAMVLAGRVPAARNRVYHITDGSNTTISELVALIVGTLQCAEPRRVLPAVVPRLANAVCGTFGRNGPVSASALRFLGTSRHVDIERARRDLGFVPKVAVAQGIAESATWLQQAALPGRAA